MMSANTFVCELFKGIAAVAHKSFKSTCYDMLRTLIHDKIVSGHMTFEDFLEPETVHAWFGYLAATYTDEDAKEFYKTILDIEKDFEAEEVDFDAHADEDEVVVAEKQEEDDEEVDAAAIERRKAYLGWREVMSPIVAAFVEPAWRKDAFIDCLWSLNEDPDMQNVYVLAKTLHAKAASLGEKYMTKMSVMNGMM